MLIYIYEDRMIERYRALFSHKYSPCALVLVLRYISLFSRSNVSDIPKLFTHIQALKRMLVCAYLFLPASQPASQWIGIVMAVGTEAAAESVYTRYH